MYNSLVLQMVGKAVLETNYRHGRGNVLLNWVIALVATLSMLSWACFSMKNQIIIVSGTEKMTAGPMNLPREMLTIIPRGTPIPTPDLYAVPYLSHLLPFIIRYIIKMQTNHISFV